MIRFFFTPRWNLVDVITITTAYRLGFIDREWLLAATLFAVGVLASVIGELHAQARKEG